MIRGTIKQLLSGSTHFLCGGFAGQSVHLPVSGLREPDRVCIAWNMRASPAAAIRSNGWDAGHRLGMLCQSLEALAALVVVGDHGRPLAIARVLGIQLQQLVAHIPLCPPRRRFSDNTEPGPQRRGFAGPKHE